MDSTPNVPAIHVRVTGDRVEIGGFATTYLAGPAATGGAYALIEHTLGPGLLGAPPHRHAREDELSCVLEGTLAVWREGTVIEGGPGTVVPKPRGEWHTFWNPGPAPVRFLEIVSPPGFEGYFRDLAVLIPERGAPDLDRVEALAARYGLDMDFEGIAPLAERYGLRLG